MNLVLDPPSEFAADQRLLKQWSLLARRAHALSVAGRRSTTTSATMSSRYVQT
jgi:hypothetical protein